MRARQPGAPGVGSGAQDPGRLSRDAVQPQALAVYRETGAAGIRWWSIHESLWANYTLFDRSVPALSVAEIRPLELGDPAVAEAAEFLGLPPGST